MFKIKIITETISGQINIKFSNGSSNEIIHFIALSPPSKIINVKHPIIPNPSKYEFSLTRFLDKTKFLHNPKYPSIPNEKHKIKRNVFQS